jgi:hypothetical protein
MRVIKIVLLVLLLAGLAYVGAALLVAWRANAEQRSLEQALARLATLGHDQVEQLAAERQAVQPVEKACAAIAPVAAEEVVAYLAPSADADVPGLSEPLLLGARDDALVRRRAQPGRVPGLFERSLQVLRSPPWRWIGMLAGPDRSRTPPVEAAELLVVARPTMLQPPAAGGAVGGMAVMQVAVFDLRTGKRRCRGGLADPLAGEAWARRVPVLALDHLCALGGTALCRLTRQP